MRGCEPNIISLSVAKTVDQSLTPPLLVELCTSSRPVVEPQSAVIFICILVLDKLYFAESPSKLKESERDERESNGIQNVNASMSGNVDELV